MWNADGKAVGIVREHQGQVNSLVFRGDGHAIVSGSSDHVVLLSDVEKNVKQFGRLLAPQFKGIDDSVRSVAISPDDQRIVVGSSDATVRTGDWLSSQIELPRHLRSRVECGSCLKQRQPDKSVETHLCMWKNALL